MNKELLKRIAQHIEEEPRGLNMKIWGVKDLKGKNSPPCGTVACVAGWAVFLTLSGTPKNFLGIETPNEARGLLGLTDLQAEDLFFVGNWPFEFRIEYRTTWKAFDVPAERARITAARIRHMIKTGE